MSAPLRHSAGTKVAGTSAGGQFKSAEHSDPGTPRRETRRAIEDLIDKSLEDWNETNTDGITQGEHLWSTLPDALIAQFPALSSDSRASKSGRTPVEIADEAIAERTDRHGGFSLAGREDFRAAVISAIEADRADRHQAESEQGVPCRACGVSFRRCTALLFGADGKACCRTCSDEDTHDDPALKRG